MNKANIEIIKLHHDGMEFTALTSGTGTPVFLIHGFPDSPHTWTYHIQALASAGYRVIAPTCRGYEPSSQPANRDYSQPTLARDLLNWMDELNIERAHFIGHDWGSSICQTAAKLAPERCLSLTIMAVPTTNRFIQATLKSPMQMRNSSYMAFFQLPHLSERKLQKNNFAMLDTLWHRWSPQLAGAPHKVKQAFRRKGVSTAALSYYRQALNLRNYYQHSKLFKRPFTPPTLAVYGEQDGCIDPKIFRRSINKKDFGNRLEVTGIANAGHFMNLDQPEKTAELLLGWLDQHSPQQG